MVNDNNYDNQYDGLKALLESYCFLSWWKLVYFSATEHPKIHNVALPWKFKKTAATPVSLIKTKLGKLPS